jgi:hypothetical protein
MTRFFRLLGVSWVARKMAHLADPRLAVGGGSLFGLMGVDLGPQFVKPAVELFERPDHLLDPLRPQTEFFHQPYTRRRRRERRIQAALRVALGATCKAR